MTPVVRPIAWLAAGWLLVPLAAAAADPPAAPRGPALSIAVAPFEGVAPPGATLPDVATLLADRIGTRGVSRVVGPAQLGVPAVAEPKADVARAWAEKAEVAALVVGRTTRIGDRLSVDVRVRSGASGEVEGTFVAEVKGNAQLESAVDRLAEQVVGETRRLVGVPEAPAVAAAQGRAAPAAPVAPATSAAPAPAPAAAAGGPKVAPPLGLGSLMSDAPLEIHSEELEAFRDDGARRLVFSKDVRVRQQDVTITSDRLEAFYPPRSSQPNRLVATGRVAVVKGRREARCDEATYDRAADRLVCRGHAELREGDDRVRGKVIEFDLTSDRVFVKGGASVLIHPEEAEGSAARDGG